jgi:hypothetical protein
MALAIHHVPDATEVRVSSRTQLQTPETSSSVPRAARARYCASLLLDLLPFVRVSLFSVRRTLAAILSVLVEPAKWRTCSVLLEGSTRVLPVVII